MNAFLKISPEHTWAFLLVLFKRQPDCHPVWKKSIGKYWIQYFFLEFPILYREKSIRCDTCRYLIFMRDVLEYSNMVITISLSVGCMCCPPIPPPLSGRSQSDTRWRWLGYTVRLGYMGKIERACAVPGITIPRYFRVWNLWSMKELLYKKFFKKLSSGTNWNILFGRGLNIIHGSDCNLVEILDFRKHTK